ncbi:MAG: O-antigen ligase family protein [Candidatus Tectomicrobia bacterium]|uniref:O-antigen ligase family protein n=1 Tax=Tectimicrobiota bacterium TaxID=2528274 RepID=A0A932MMX9_UNCTE|nr:O-antigen ligase family protein [Candidatus Tectomicrobia bacterium]
MARTSRAIGGGGLAGRGSLLPVVAVLGFLILSLGLSYSLTQTSAFVVLGGFVGAIILGASFMSPMFGVALLIMSMLLSPEFGAGGGGGGGTDAGRSVVVRMDDVLLAILSIAWFARTAVHKELGFILKNPLNRPIGFYILSCIISTILGFMTGGVRGLIGTFFVIRYFEYFVVFFLALNFMTDLKVMKRFMKLAFFTSICIALYGMVQIPLGVRVSAPFEGDSGEPNTMGGYLLLMMCMAGGQLLFARGLRAILGWGSLIALFFIPLLFTGSRASWLGIPAVIAAFFIFSHKKKQIALFTVAFAFLSIVVLPQSVKERVLFTFQQKKQLHAKQIQVGAVRLDSSTSARLESYAESVGGWMKKPILGWGVTGYIFVDSQPIRTLVETGLVGMVAFLWLVWVYFQAGRKAMRTSTDAFQRGIAVGYMAGLFGLLTHSSGSNTFIILRIMEPWMLFTAMVVRIPTLAKERQKQWEELEREEGKLIEAPPEPQPEPAEGEEAPGEKRFEKKLSEYEEFLERERVEMARREVEARRREAAKPKFRKELLAAARAGGPPAAPGPEPAAGSFPKAPRNVDLIREPASGPFGRRPR